MGWPGLTGCMSGGRYLLPIDSNDRFCPNSNPP